MSTTYLGDGLYSRLDAQVPGQLEVFASDGQTVYDRVYINDDNVAELISELLKHNIIGTDALQRLISEYEVMPHG